MEFPPATVTNSVTNALHATALFVYFSLAWRHYLRKDSHFNSLLLVLPFLNLFVLKVIGVVVHYFTPMLSKTTISVLWSTVDILTVTLNGLVLYMIPMRQKTRQLALGLSILFNLLFFYTVYHCWQDPTCPKEVNGNYLFLSLSTFVAFSVVAYQTQGLLRWGFILTIFSSALWIAMRQLASRYVDLDAHPEWKYDNDIYHLLLILSSFTVYYAIARDGIFHTKGS
jgi:hypothetical protein